MRDVDLSDVPPMLRAQVRRRVRAIHQYLSPTKPKAHTAQHFADKLGISESLFRTLVKTWRKYQKASKLPGATPVGGHPDELEGEIASVVEQIGTETVPGARLDDIMRRLRVRCTQLSLKAPRRAAVARHLAKHRAVEPKAPMRHRSGDADEIGTHTSYNGPPLLLTCHLNLGMAVLDDEGAPAATIALIAVLVPEYFIVSHFVTTEPATVQSEAQVLLAALGRQTTGAPTRALTYNPGAEPGWSVLATALTQAGVSMTCAQSSPWADLNSVLRDLLARPPGNRELSPNADQKTRVLLAEAMASVDKAVDKFNTDMGWSTDLHSTPPFAITPEGKIGALRRRLAIIAKQRTGPIRAR